MSNTITPASTQMMNSHKRVHTFSININGYTGEFTVKYPALMDRMKIGVLRSKYLDGMIDNIDMYTDNVAYMAAALNTIIIKKPVWFDLEQLDDYNVLEAVFDEYLNWANSFRTDSEHDNNAGDSRTGTNAEAVENNEDVSDSGK